jgi:putative PIN family toxin of toxin-antitoxin system
MMRVVLDTNVVVSALIWGGTPFRLVQAATAGDIELYTSPVLLAELREVLSREPLAGRLVAQRSSVEAAIGLYGELAISVSPLAAPRTVPGDADDDHVVAAAVAARADLIVSGDRHLLDLGGEYQGIRIVSPAQAVAITTTTGG